MLRQNIPSSQKIPLGTHFSIDANTSTGFGNTLVTGRRGYGSFRKVVMQELDVKDEEKLPRCTRQEREFQEKGTGFRKSQKS